jgi:dTDP-4-dehydrorhamnose reductase
MCMKQRAWITGTGGLIGSQIHRLAPQLAPDWEVRALARNDLDFCDFKAVSTAFAADRPQLVIHCAALSKSPVCEANPDLAWRSNFEATVHLAQLAADIQFIFFSTDLVFDGRQGSYSEAAPVNPLSVYGKTKAAAEEKVLANPKHTVIRTSLNAGRSPTGDRAFNEQMRLAWQRGEKSKLFTDEYRSPIVASVTARAIWEIAALQAAGIYHLAGAERLSRWQIGQALAALYPDLHPILEASSLKEYPGAPRPPDTSLNCAELQALLSFPLPRFSEWLKRPDPGL